jgi:serine/threonine-protein kinase
MRLTPGTRIAAYRIESVIGEGGMGVVYRAHDLTHDRPVALKVLHTNLAGDAGIRRRFAREARILRAYSHPNIVKNFDFVEHEHLLAIVMEIVDGPSLTKYLEKWRGVMPLAEVRDIFSGVLLAIEQGHRLGVVHRDLKPDNVLVTRVDGAVCPKVVDFGIARILEGTTYTVTGALLGTCCYMSPEQIQHPELADARSDIYSLGISLYQLCTGSVPFEGNHFSVMMAHVNQAPRPPSALRADLPPLLERLVLDAIAKEPQARPASCSVFRQRLVEALSEVSPRQPHVDSLPPLLKGPLGDEMILVPSGPFQMGSRRRTVHLDAFYIDKTPVTNRDYAAFLELTGYRPQGHGADRFAAHWRDGRSAHGAELLPMVYVSWADAAAFAAWAGKRLPTEAEWEKAARGSDGRKYPWGRSEPGPSHAHFGAKALAPAPVGSYPAGASPYGVLDMAGNVWEWCEDYDDPSFYVDGPTHNPQNQRRGRGARVMRGGAYLYGARSLRTYARTSFQPHYRFALGGFRCARSAAP